MSTHYLIPLALLSLCIGCGQKEDTGEPEGDTDTDADTDTDTDTDADTDTDTDVDMGLAALADDAPSSTYLGEWILDIGGQAHLTYGEDSITLDGELTYYTAQDATTQCDNTIALTGTQYTGACLDCDWAFTVEGTITAENGTADCYMSPSLSFVDETGTYHDFFMSYWNAYIYDGYYGYYRMDQLFAAAFAYGSYPGPYWQVISYDGYPYGTFTMDGQLDFSWTFDYTSAQYETNYYEYCGTYVYNYATGGYEGQSAQGEIDCEAGVLDVWTFDANAGDNVTITVDTVSAADTFDPAFWINDPSGCTVTGADDTFTCTYPPPKYSCPSALIRGAEAGTYEVVIYHYDCVAATGGYEIRVGLE